MFVKVCGLARREDARLTAQLYPDALGFIFWPKSPRAVTAEQVAEWTASVPPGILKVGVFVNQTVADVLAAFDTAGLDIAQLHGDEDAAYIAELDRPVWKAVHLDRQPSGLRDLPARAFLIDSGTKEQPGGTGKVADWERGASFVSETDTPVLLAGGLKAGNVASAIAQVSPWGVDVSSGVEKKPGVKDMLAVEEFILNARNA